MTPVTPVLEFAFEIRADIAPALQAGPGKLGERRHIPILGGSVAGPRLNGRILPGGSDWALLRRDGASIVDAHYTVQADDGTPIYVHNRGLRVAEGPVLERLRRGEPVAPHEVYFRTSPVFDAPDGPHAWLCDRLFVAAAARVGEQVHIRVFLVG